MKKPTRWQPENFELQTSTVWSFPDRGNWATHTSDYPGNWSPYIPRNLLLRYSQEGDLILDQFAGGGTTLIEAKLLHRDAIGVDINPAALQRCLEVTQFTGPNCGETYLWHGDARNLDFVPNGAVDFICTHPPYANIIRYSEDINGDLSLLGQEEFLMQMWQVALECYRVLGKGKYCAIQMGDIRKDKKVFPLGNRVQEIFIDVGFSPKEVILKEQHNCRSTPYWKERSKKYNFLLLAHEYIFVFVKE